MAFLLLIIDDLELAAAACCSMAIFLGLLAGAVLTALAAVTLATGAGVFLLMTIGGAGGVVICVLVLLGGEVSSIIGVDPRLLAGGRGISVGVSFVGGVITFSCGKNSSSDGGVVSDGSTGLVEGAGFVGDSVSVLAVDMVKL